MTFYKDTVCVILVCPAAADLLLRRLRKTDSDDSADQSDVRTASRARLWLSKCYVATLPRLLHARTDIVRDFHRDSDNKEDEESVAVSDAYS